MQNQANGTLRADGLALLAFCDTQTDKINYLATDMKVIAGDAPFGPARVCGGFRNNALALLPPIQTWLAGPSARGTWLLQLLGQSLGSAIATLPVLHIRCRRTRHDHLASTRAGDVDFAVNLLAPGLPHTHI